MRAAQRVLYATWLKGLGYSSQVRLWRTSGQREQAEPGGRRSGRHRRRHEIVWTTKGVANRLAQGLIDPVTGEGFQGLLGFDLDGDGAVDVSTWIVGPNDEIPVNAQFNGPASRA